MASATKKFMFDADFTPGASEADRPVPRAEHALKLAEAESKGYGDGFKAAERERVAEAERRTAVAFEQIGDALDRLARGLAAVETRLEAEAVEVAAAVGRKLAPELVGREPFAEISALAVDCFKQLVTAPHIVVRVNDALLAVAKERLGEAARMRGFEGRLVVLAEPEIEFGDCRIEWADGGVTRDSVRTDAAIAEMVRRYVTARLGAPPAAPENPSPEQILPELGEIPA
jgi:flagellar assembly protein FliH